ncbi:mitochondrial ribosome assembly protein RRG9 PWA37_003265 [Arxiozyma heterogenica]|uniref:Required for respiratory growth protein 9, mitochondrial n=1 Tax=Arxiozyma heterogenica TaxID=278026 RepID=A0AAN7WHT3_9SACH|nr:hypothetical protein RI543_001745 [Kazachstania heterogenica]
MSKKLIREFVRRFHRTNIICNKQKGLDSIKNTINKASTKFPSTTVLDTKEQAQKTIIGNYNVKKALKFIDASSLSNKNDLLIDLQVSQNKLDWQIQKDALKKKFQGAHWNPPKRLSRQEMESVRLLKQQFPTMTASDLASRFKISPEAVRRILKAKWTPKEEDLARIESRWSRRGERIKQMYRYTHQNKTSHFTNNINTQPVITLKYNPNGTIHDYYTKNDNKEKNPQGNKKYTQSKNKFYLLHKNKV